MEGRVFLPTRSKYPSSSSAPSSSDPNPPSDNAYTGGDPYAEKVPSPKHRPRRTSFESGQRPFRTIFNSSYQPHLSDETANHYRASPNQNLHSLTMDNGVFSSNKNRFDPNKKPKPRSQSFQHHHEDQRRNCKLPSSKRTYQDLDDMQYPTTSTSPRPHEKSDDPQHELNTSLPSQNNHPQSNSKSQNISRLKLPRKRPLNRQDQVMPWDQTNQGSSSSSPEIQVTTSQEFGAQKNPDTCGKRPPDIVDLDADNHPNPSSSSVFARSKITGKRPREYSEAVPIRKLNQEMKHKRTYAKSNLAQTALRIPKVKQSLETDKGAETRDAEATTTSEKVTIVEQVVDGEHDDGVKTERHKLRLGERIPRPEDEIAFDQERAIGRLKQCQSEQSGIINLSYMGIKPKHFTGPLMAAYHIQREETTPKAFNCSHNCITKIPPGFVNKAVDWNVTYLDLSYNTIVHFKFPIENSLRALILSNNYLYDLPHDVFAELRHLQLLDLSYNSLEHLPPKLRELQNLEVLDISSNNLKCLPSDAFGEGSSIRTLMVAHNPSFAELPECAIHMEKIEGIYLQGTKLQDYFVKCDYKKNAYELVSHLARMSAKRLEDRKAKVVKRFSRAKVDLAIQTLP